MSAPMLVQSLVIALVVAWSAVFAARRLLPVASRRAQARLVGLFDRPSVPALLRTAARRMQPLSSSGGSCGDGCSSCGGCAAAATQPAATVMPTEAIPLVFHPRSKT